jgi:DNA (cytosine-5)-methyltransferase 1
MKYEVLNLHAGIGGNRELWENVNVTAIELNPEIAEIYKDRFPNDTVIIADANEYARINYKKFGFIWASPPCQSHSKVRMMASKSGSYDAILPDMKLWALIIFLEHFAIGKYCIENVDPYYKPLVKPTAKLGRHLFWTNFSLSKNIFTTDYFDAIKGDNLKHNERGMNHKGFIDLSKYSLKHRKDQIIRNAVNPELGKYIFDCATGKDN